MPKMFRIRLYYNLFRIKHKRLNYEENKRDLTLPINVLLLFMIIFHNQHKITTQNLPYDRV